MKKVKAINAITIIAIVIILFWFTEINYSDLSFGENRSAYLGIISMLLLSFAMQMEKRRLKK
jgi:fucose 4-O-acetylase-like acetyltransferase